MPTFEETSHVPNHISLLERARPSREGWRSRYSAGVRKRPWHDKVLCVWDGKELLLHAESDWDADGKALVDEFSDSISACIEGGFDGAIEVRAISLVSDGP
jgi:hypothetical protein